MSQLPRIFLDFDGVVNALSSEHAFGDTETPEGDLGWVRYSPSLIRGLASLRAEIVWLSYWGRDIEPVASGIGCPPWAFTEFSAHELYRSRSHPKLNRVLGWSRLNPKTPLVWIDDSDMSADDRATVSGQHDAPCLFLNPAPATGMSPDQLHDLRMFVQEHSS